VSALVLLLGADSARCSWKFACVHVKLDSVDEDEEDVRVSVDFHDTGLPLKCLHDCHGDAQDYLCSTYPSFSENIWDFIDKYFTDLQVPNLLDKFKAVHELHGDARRAALEADVKVRASDLGDSPVVIGRVNKRNHSEAYDEHEESVETPGGTKGTKTVRVEVDTPTFVARLEANSRAGVSSRVDSSLQLYDQLLERVDSEGFLSKEARAASKLKAGGKANVIGMKAHLDVLAAKDKKINNLRVQLTQAKKADVLAAEAEKTGAVATELVEAKETCGCLLTKVQNLQARVSELEGKLALSTAEKQAAVAEAKVQVMQQMFSASNALTPELNRSNSIGGGSSL
jgi:hypothetical protein